MHDASPSLENESAPSRAFWLMLIASLVVALVVLVRAPLRESLWLDEAVSAWVSDGSIADVVHRALTYQGQSPFYFLLLQTTRAFLGSSELALRAPSILLIALSAFLFYRLATLWLGSEAALFSLLLYVSNDGVIRGGISARPYALALCAVLASTYFFVQWLRCPRISFLVFYVVTSALIFYAHYLFGAVLAVHWIYLLRAREYRSHWKSLMLAHAAVLILLLPIVQQLLALPSQRALWSFAKMPGLPDLIKAYFPVAWCVYIAVPLILIAINFGIPRRFSWPRHSAALISWWLLPALLLAVISWLTGSSLFVDRLYLWSAPALSLIGAVLLSQLSPSARARRLAFLVLFALVLYREGGRVWHIEDWKRAAHNINFGSDFQAPFGPTLLYSGLIEADDVAGYKDPERAAYLHAPFNYYRTRKEALLLPSRFVTEDQKRYLAERVLPLVERERGAILVVPRMRRFPSDEASFLVNDRLLSVFTERGYKVAPLYSPGKEYDVVQCLAVRKD